MSIFSLPNQFGIGTFGKECFDFIDFLHTMNFKWWQILPLNPSGAGNSPYSSDSAFAINPLYIDMTDLLKQNLISETDLDLYINKEAKYTAAYDEVQNVNLTLLKKAFENFDTSNNDFQKFVSEQNYWLCDYSEYKSLKENLPDDFYSFVQYTAHSQWKKVRAYANEKNLKILGDMPIYISRDSADFEYNKNMFLVDKNGNPKLVAGVPPDYYSEDGQLWGNPLYNVEEMKKDGYKWWINRIRRNLDLFDAVRIDHFRAFYKFWAVDASCTTAKNGVWLDGPGYDFFKIVKQNFSDERIIAEDLGAYDEGLCKFIDALGYMTMKVIQFGFNSEGSAHIPYLYGSNNIAYTSTHDNNTLLGWLWEIPLDEKEKLLEYCGYDGDVQSANIGGSKSPVLRKIIENVWKSGAGIAVTTPQDMLGFGKDTRVNIPGKESGNWQWRITTEQLNDIDKNYFRKINRLYGR